MKTRIFTLEGFCEAVNNLAQCEADRLSKNDFPFKGVHHDFPTRMLEHYYKEGLSPKATLEAITQDAEAENAAEARMS